MPSLAQTTPSWVAELTNDIPLNGVPALTKTKPAVSKPATATPSQANGKPASTAGTSAPENPATKHKSEARVKYEKDKKEFDDALTNASSAVGRVFEDLFREVASDNSHLIVVIQELGVKIENINISLEQRKLKQEIDEHNRAVRFWNASILDRKETTLRPLKDINGNTIHGLSVKIDELEHYPDLIKAALLLHIGVEHAEIAFQTPHPENDEKAHQAADPESLDNLRKFQFRANLLTERQKRTPIEQGLAFGPPPQDVRLTRQLRAAVGLAPIWFDSV